MQHCDLSRFQNNVVNHDGTKVALDDLKKHKFIGLYFSAHWCPPCRGFTPVLAQWYNDVRAKNQHDVEVIFISSDQDEPKWKEYFGSMPWKSLAFGDALKGALGSEFGVTGIPCFGILKGDGTFVTKDGRGHVQAHGESAIEQWSK